MILKQKQINLAVSSADKIVSIYYDIIEKIKEGQTLLEIDEIINKSMIDHKCRSCFLHYRIPGKKPFPYHSCLSLNDCIVHGMSDYSQHKIQSGDLLKIDIGISYNCFLADVGWTFSVKNIKDDTNKNLMLCGKECLLSGIKELKVGNTFYYWAKKVEEICKKYNFQACKYLGGHGYGLKLHEPPFISNRLSDKDFVWLEENNEFLPFSLLAVEPMISSGLEDIVNDIKDWPVFTADKSMSSHYEANVLVLPEGPLNLTEKMKDLPEVIG